MKWLIRGFLVVLLPTMLGGCGTALVLGSAAAVGAGSTVVFNDRRAWEVQRADGDLEDRLEHLFESDAQLAGKADIRATSFNQVVLLAGYAPTDSLRALAAKLTAEYPGVRRVHNELKLGEAPDAGDTRNQDIWLATKVIAALLGNYGFDSSLVEVVARQGTVYLMGLLTRDEASHVIEKVRAVDGVQNVVTLFEYVRLVPEGES